MQKPYRLLFCAFLALSACRQQRDGAGDGADTTAATEAVEADSPDRQDSSSVFDPATLAPGDTMAGLRVTSVSFRRAFEDSVWVGDATFEGEVPVSGRYATHYDCPGVPEACIPCFYADTTSTARLPRLSEDERYAWFCFYNSEEAVAAMGSPAPRRPEPGGRAAEIVIGRYHYVVAYSDVYNEAVFIREIRK